MPDISSQHISPLNDPEIWPWKKPVRSVIPDKNLPKITVVTPSYNQGAFIERTILSVLHQDYPDLEYIIIDGGSTDESGSILEKYGENLAYWVSEKDRGQAHAINKGFSRATGEIICWLNSDDILQPETLVKVASIYQSLPKPCVLSGSCRFITDQGKLIWESEGLSDNSVSQKNYTPYMLLQCWKHSLAQPSTFWSRNIFDKIGYLDEDMNFGMDLEFWLRCIQNNIPVYTTSQIFSTFLYHSQSKTVSQQELLANDLLNLSEKHLTTPELKRNYQVNFYIWKNCLRRLDLAFWENDRRKRFRYLMKAFLAYPPIIFSQPRRFLSLFKKVLL